MANSTDASLGAPPQKKPRTTKSSTNIEPLNASLAASSIANPPKPTEVLRTAYKPLTWIVKEVELDFSLHDGYTVVESTYFIGKNPNANDEDEGLVLNGDETNVKLLSLALDGNELKDDTGYELSPGKLVISNVKEGSVVKMIVEIVPEDNTQLSGLYKSGGMFCSQCEAEGFRRITYYPDRPDVMATFKRVRIEADKAKFPVLLSNGNKLDEGDCNDDRHFAVWQDPYPKPSYLFALAAGDLGCLSDTYTTMSGRKVDLKFYSEHGNVSKLSYALESLKRAMKWDEDTFGLEYDLDLFNVVAVESFNMGAMENKSLNVFNISCVLADSVTSTDANYQRVEGIIGHEYFHNWTGNRVTCRDWFQLTLKEGLTVFRDQQFSGQVNNSMAVTRIENVGVVRGRQFQEDAGPMSHSIRPDSYVAMDNFYTATVYRKGAEVIRMYDTILGSKGFRAGMDLYFKRHDGQAVTCDEFLAAMADANNVDLSQFARWYSTSGTPTVSYSSTFDAEKSVYKLTLSQSSRSKDPLFIPVAVGLLDKKSGEEVVSTTILELKEAEQTFEFPNLKGDVVPSVLRNFSAPVKLVPVNGIDESELAFLASRDTDGFNRWDSAQRLYTCAILKVMNKEDSESTLNLVLETFVKTLTDNNISDDSIRAYALTLPGESTLAEAVEVIDPPAIHEARKQVKNAIARTFKDQLTNCYDKLTSDIEKDGSEFRVDGVSVGRRRLRNVCLAYLCAIADTADEQKTAAAIATKHFESATGMTDKLSAFKQLVSMSGEGEAARDAAIKKFYDDARGDPLVLDKWFASQASADLPDIIERVKNLVAHPDYSIEKPNRCRSVIMSFTMNEAAFHEASGKGYEFLGEMLEKLDAVNPKVAARTTAGSLIGWKRYGKERASMMKAQLEKLNALPRISNDLSEIVAKGLK